MIAKVITFHYTVKSADGEVLDQSAGGEPMAVLTGQNQIIAGLEKALTEMAEGESKSLTVAAGEAYGERNDELVSSIERSHLPEGDLQVGQMFSVTDDQGRPAGVVRVVSFDDASVTLDANHPLAGMDLQFDVEVVGVRPATAEEMSHGHAHGAGGHHH